jgi:hypothetical protein
MVLLVLSLLDLLALFSQMLLLVLITAQWSIVKGE